MNEGIYLVVYGVSRIYCFVVIISELCVWVRSVDMSFGQVL